METSKHWLSLRRYTVVFVVLTAISRGSACEAPSSPECFRKNADESKYMCEWRMNTTHSDVKFDFYFEMYDEEIAEVSAGLTSATKTDDIKVRTKRKLGTFKNTSGQFLEDQVTNHEDVNIWVEARVGNSSCASVKSRVILADIIKYEAPHSISMSWVKNNLHLNWRAAENHPALAEVRFRQDEGSSWQSRSNTTTINETTSMFQMGLLRNSSYQVQIRQQSTQAPRPLWSPWSSDVQVPAELEENPEVTVKTQLLNGNRNVTLYWKPMPGVNYSVFDTQSAHGCPCLKGTNHIQTNEHTVYVSYSAVNISVVAKNAAGYSPPAVIHLPAVRSAADVEACDVTSLQNKRKLERTACLELYEVKGDGQTPDSAVILTGKQGNKRRKEIEKNLTDFVRYLYFEHKCEKGTPRTVKTCLYYKEEGAPLTEPQSFSASDETHSSINLSWQPIPYADRRGFLIHYSLCSETFSPQQDSKKCNNISATLTEYRLEDLTPATKYSITLAGVTKGGEGPKATFQMSTQPEKPFNVWWSLSLLFLFFLLTTSCTIVLKRVKMKLFPPVPTPVIDLTSYPRENQEMLERKEEVSELTILKVHPDGKSVPEETEEGTADGIEEENERGDSRTSGEISDEDSDCTDEALRSSREGETADLDKLENEFAMLIYRNGLVFDLKTDSP